MARKKRITLQTFYEEFRSISGEIQNRIGGFESSQRSVLAELVTINSRFESLEESTSRLGTRLDVLHGLCEGWTSGSSVSKTSIMLSPPL